MAGSAGLKAFLTEQKVAFKSRKHPVVYTAQEIAAAQHVSGKKLAKCVLVKVDNGFCLAVLSAVQRLDFVKLKGLLRAKRLSLASEADIKRLFPDVEVGAMSPFGNLYNLPTIVEKTLATSEEMVCNAGTHAETLTLRYRDFEKVAKPKVGAFGILPQGPKPSKPRPAAKKRSGARRPVKRSRVAPRRRRTR